MPSTKTKQPEDFIPIVTPMPSHRPAPANDYVTLTITMTREEWRAIENDIEPSSGFVKYQSNRDAAHSKLLKAIRRAT